MNKQQIKKLEKLGDELDTLHWMLSRPDANDTDRLCKGLIATAKSEIDGALRIARDEQ